MSILENLRDNLTFLYNFVEKLEQDKLNISSEDHDSHEKLEILQNRIAKNKANIIHVKAMIRSLQIYEIIIAGACASSDVIESLNLTKLYEHSIFCEKLSRKRIHSGNSLFKLFNYNKQQKLSFFVEHKLASSYPDGGFALKVKKAYNNLPSHNTQGQIEIDLSNPDFALKIFRNTLRVNELHILRVAMRGAFCSRLLGRTGLSFKRNNKHYLLCSWLNGKSLDLVHVEEISEIPLHKRIVFALGLIKELAILHACGIVHNDIKPGNVMLDVESGALHLFDFDSVRLEQELIHDVNFPIYTPSFLEPKNHADIITKPETVWSKLNKSSDIYALGVTLGYVFAEIMNPLDEEVTTHISKGGQMYAYTFSAIRFEKGSEFNSHIALGNFIKQLTISEAFPDEMQESTETKSEQMNESLVSLSINNVFDALLEILHNNYQDNFTAQELEALPDLTILAEYSEDIAKTAFLDEIESEILSYRELARRLAETQSTREAQSYRML